MTDKTLALLQELRAMVRHSRLDHDFESVANRCTQCRALKRIDATIATMQAGSRFRYIVDDSLPPGVVEIRSADGKQVVRIGVDK